MDNNQTKQIKSRKAEQMQNWKKQILMDPVLNGLYDTSTPAQEFFTSRIASLQHRQIAALFSKLSTVHFELSQNLQKQVEAKSSLVEKSYNQLIAYKQQMEDHARTSSADAQAFQHLNHLKAFNKKYETVEQSIVLWKNISDCLRFSKAYQNFKVSTNIMKTRMRGYNGNEDAINPFTIAKTLKQIIQLSSDNDFTGIKGFENERVFISSTKSIIHAMGCKALPKLLLQHVSLSAQEKDLAEKTNKSIEDWITALANIGTLKQFVLNYGKSMIRDMPENIKKNMRGDLVNLGQNTEKILIPYLQESCKAIILLEEKLILVRKVDLSNIPNLFGYVWEKLCITLKQNIASLKNQQARTPPKVREQAIVWKYPTLYASFAKLCSSIQTYLIQSVNFNSYHFGKNKEKLMVACLLDLAIQYHIEKQKLLSEVIKAINKKFVNSQEMDILEESKDQKDQKETNKNLQQYLNQIQFLFKDSKCEIIYHSLLTCLCEKLSSLSLQPRDENGSEDKPEEAQRKQKYIKMVKRVKKQIKAILIRYGESYGVDKTQLQSFKLQ